MSYRTASHPEMVSRHRSLSSVLAAAHTLPTKPSEQENINTKVVFTSIGGPPSPKMITHRPSIAPLRLSGCMTERMDVSDVGTFVPPRLSQGILAFQCDACGKAFNDWNEIVFTCTAPHVYHVDCMRTWVNRNAKTCPRCELPLSKAASAVVSHMNRRGVTDKQLLSVHDAIDRDETRREERAGFSQAISSLQCDACLEDFNDWNEIVFTCTAPHVYHVDCLRQWVKHNPKTCPQCKLPLSKAASAVVTAPILLMSDEKLQAIHDAVARDRAGKERRDQERVRAREEQAGAREERRDQETRVIRAAVALDQARHPSK